MVYQHVLQGLAINQKEFKGSGFSLPLMLGMTANKPLNPSHSTICTHSAPTWRRMSPAVPTAHTVYPHLSQCKYINTRAICPPSLTNFGLIQLQRNNNSVLLFSVCRGEKAEETAGSNIRLKEEGKGQRGEKLKKNEQF